MAAVLVLYIVCLLSVFIVLRMLFLMFQVFSNNCSVYCKNTSLRTIMCIGSGGHTTELLKIANNLNFKKYQPRLYILADNDKTSEGKIHKTEQTEASYVLSRIPRSRNVNQSYTSSLFSTLYALIYTIPVIYNFKPEVILCNGPGTCIPVCVVAFLMRCLFILDCRIVFIESICRVRTLSLTGKILQFFADVIVVQWPQLRDASFRAKYFGRLT